MVKKLRCLSVYTLSLVMALMPLLSPIKVFADDLTDKRVVVSSSIPGASVSTELYFTIPSFTNLGSIKFEYCDGPLPGTPCFVPLGFSAAGATLGNQTGETGFNVQAGSPSNEVVLTRTAAPSSAIPVSYRLDNITNPSDPNTPVYIRITTYASEDATGPESDFGAVAFSTAQNIAVNGYVPPYIIFCVGVTVAVNCSASNGSQLSFGELTTSKTGALTSQYSGSTNDPGGFTTSVHGTTMTSGSNQIPSLGSPQASATGQSQFGMNLRDNSAPDVGENPVGAGSSSAIAQFNNPNLFFFNNQVISSSPISTDFNRFTVSYIVNVSSGQTAGIYSTTLTYIAVAAF